MNSCLYQGNQYNSGESWNVQSYSEGNYSQQQFSDATPQFTDASSGPYSQNPSGMLHITPFLSFLSPLTSHLPPTSLSPLSHLPFPSLSPLSHLPFPFSPPSRFYPSTYNGTSSSLLQKIRSPFALSPH